MLHKECKFGTNVLYCIGISRFCRHRISRLVYEQITMHTAVARDTTQCFFFKTNGLV